MASLRFALPASLVVSAMIAGGCAQHVCRPYCGAHASIEFGLPAVERSRIEATVDADAAAVVPDDEADYVGLAEIECQCAAVEAAAIGRLLEHERWTVCLHDLNREERRARCLLVSALGTAAREARNKNAAEALRVYYGLMETEAGIDAVDDMLPYVRGVLDGVDDLRRRGLAVPFDVGEWRRQESTLLDRKLELTAMRDRLNAQLHGLLGFDEHGDAAARIFPTERLVLTDESLDVEAETAYGLQTKPELRLLQQLSQCDPQTTAAAIRGLIGGVHGLAGVSARTIATEFWRSTFGLHDCEAYARRAQIAEYAARRRTQLAEEMRVAARTIRTRHAQAVLAQQRLDSHHRRIEELKAKRTTGDASFVELAEARLRAVEARNAVTSAVLAWKRARLELRELQGALVEECCGICPPAGDRGATTVAAAPAAPQPLREEDLRDAVETVPHARSAGPLFSPPPIGVPTILP